MSRIDKWIVEDMVRTLEKDPGKCIVLNPSMVPKAGMPRVARDGRTVALHRYLYTRIAGEPPRECLLAACPTPGCLNPFHYEKSMRRGRRVITQCPNGHDYTPDNIERHGRYKCKACRSSRLARKRKGEHGRGYCRKGHRLSKSNVYYTTRRNGVVERRCRTCQINNQRLYRERKKQDD